jgi:EAL domain-containing protein (putative c-di-GMP-specific phosphodiesterase class I)
MALIAVVLAGTVAGGLIFAGSPFVVVVAASSAVLSILTLASFILRDLGRGERTSEASETRHLVTRIARDFATLSSRIDEIESGDRSQSSAGSAMPPPVTRSKPMPPPVTRSKPLPPPRTQADDDQMAREVEELRRSVRKLVEDYGNATDSPAEPRLDIFESRSYQPEPSEPRFDLDPPMDRPAYGARDPYRDRDAYAEPQRAAPPPPGVSHRLEFFLEPVVSLATNATEHYRSSLALEGSTGRVVTYSELVVQAARNGMRSELDYHCLERSLAVARKLMAKGSRRFIFVPIGGETLSDEEALSRIEGEARAMREAARSIIFEIDHSIMAGLHAGGVEGLARLAHHGAGMSLARAHGIGIDLAAMRELRFRFICFDAAALPSENHQVPAWAGIARVAADNGFVVAVQGVDHEEQSLAARRWVSLASGPYFALPRRVKGESAEADASRFAA